MEAARNRAGAGIPEQLFYEIFRALNILEKPGRQQLVRGVFRSPVLRFAQLACGFEQAVTLRGFPQACRELLPLFVHRVATQGAGCIPQRGPLIIASNHPGSLDALLLSSYLYRNDLRLVARDMPFLRSMPGVDACLIYSTRDHVQRATVLRQALRHLEGGGALLLFPSGNLDPDPGCFGGAAEALETWTTSLDLFLRKCPQTQVMLSIVSGVIAPRWLSHPFVRLQRQRWQRQFRAELLQTLTQVLFPRRFRISPHIVFDGPLDVETLHAAGEGPVYRQALVARAQALLVRSQPVACPPVATGV